MTKPSKKKARKIKTTAIRTSCCLLPEFHRGLCRTDANTCNAQLWYGDDEQLVCTRKLGHAGPHRATCKEPATLRAFSVQWRSDAIPALVGAAEMPPKKTLLALRRQQAVRRAAYLRGDYSSMCVSSMSAQTAYSLK